MQGKARILLAAGIGMLITASLGVWQLNRAAQKLAIAEQISLRAAQAPLDEQALLQLLKRGEASRNLHYLHARLKGQWRVAETVYLDNRPMQGRAGFIVLTPLQLQGSEQALLVQRGWVPRNFVDRKALPTINTPATPLEIEVRLTPAPSKLMQLGGGEAVNEIGAIRQNIDIERYAHEKQLKLLPLSAQQLSAKGDAQEGLLRDWPAIDSGVEKHYGYAAQWFGLAVLIAALTAWFQFIKPRRLASRKAQS